MSGAFEPVFFPRLERQGSYPLRSDGEHFSYSYYREHIAADCQHRCVYCDAHANEVGGSEAMQLDHFRPESFEEFVALINEPLNLHYACGRCNLLKSNHWPARCTDGTHNGRDGFIDPFVEDRLHYFKMATNGEISALKSPARYMIRLLRLDREFLRKLRQIRQLRERLREKVAAIRACLKMGEIPDVAELDDTFAAVEALLG